MIEISKPFEAYLVEDEHSIAGHGREGVLILPYEVARSGTMGFKRYLWKYSHDQEAQDRRSGFDGLTALRVKAIAEMRQLVEKELAESGERLYEASGRPILIWGAREG